jgi:hypothetical protein
LLASKKLVLLTLFRGNFVITISSRKLQKKPAENPFLEKNYQWPKREKYVKFFIKNLYNKISAFNGRK